MEVRGVLWIIDEIHANGLATTTALMTILRRFGNDPTVRLPRRELAAQIKRYEKEE
jgi:hypothetical protein